jgi:hypothetical protein
LETAAPGPSLLFLLFFAAKYQSSLYLVDYAAPAIGASQSDMNANIMAILALLISQPNVMATTYILCRGRPN